MKQFIFLSLVLFSFVAHAQVIVPDSAKNYIGKVITVCGEVKGTYHSTRDTTQPTFINFGADYPNATFTAVIFGDDRLKFNYVPETYLRGKTICVTGEVKEHNGKPEIILYSPSQLKENDSK